MADRPLPQIGGALGPAALKDRAGVTAWLRGRDPLFVRGMWLLVLPLGFCWNSPHLTPPPPPPPPLAPLYLHQENLLVHTAILTSGPPCPPLTLAPSAVGAGLPQAWVSRLLAPRAPQPHPHPCCWLLALPWLLAGTPLSCVSTRAGGREACSGEEGAAAHPSRSSLLFQGLRGRAVNPTPAPGSSCLQKRAGRCQEPLPQTASLPLPRRPTSRWPPTRAPGGSSATLSGAPLAASSSAFQSSPAPSWPRPRSPCPQQPRLA